LKTGITGKVYGQANSAQDRAVVAEQEHNITCTLVWAFSMRGVAMPPLVIEKESTKRSKPLRVAQKYQRVSWALTESGFINSEIFYAWACDLRQFVGHMEPLILLSDGHTTRTSADMVKKLAALNIHLFLIPPNTSHALAASDQFHQHIHRRRMLLERALRLKKGCLNPDDKQECLLQAIDECMSLTGLMRTAFEHAGISRACRSTRLLRDKPSQEAALDSGMAGRLRSAGSTGSLETPSNSQVSDLPSPELRRIARRHIRTKEASGALLAQAALVAARPRELREERARAQAVRESLRTPIRGIMHGDEMLAKLQGKRDARVGKTREKEQKEKLGALRALVRRELAMPALKRNSAPTAEELMVFLLEKGIDDFARSPDMDELLRKAAAVLDFPLPGATAGSAEAAAGGYSVNTSPVADETPSATAELSDHVSPQVSSTSPSGIAGSPAAGSAAAARAEEEEHNTPYLESHFDTPLNRDDMQELIKARSLIYKTVWQALNRLADDCDKEEAAQAADERKSKKAKAGH
jgi:hypothetical protein